MIDTLECVQGIGEVRSIGVDMSLVVYYGLSPPVKLVSLIVDRVPLVIYLHWKVLILIL